jgi:hypothetical protein
LIELFIAEDEAAAKDLFHEIVVEKSRDIYESLTDEDQVEETAEVEEDAVEEAEEIEEESDFDEAELGGDAADDMIGDIEADEEGLSMEDDDADEEIEDRVVDLEDALDELKAEFEALMGGDDAADDDAMDMEPEMDMDMGDEEGEEEPEEEQFAPELGIDNQPAFEGQKSQAEQMREYVEKVSAPSNNADKSKSPVAGKNDMGGTTANIAKGSAEEKGGTGASAPKEENAGNVNVPGGKASKSLSNAKGHGAEKKGAGEGSVDDKSIIGS